jgi:very-short-patch-repair endonuclease
LNLKLAESTDLLPSLRPPKPLGEGGWRGGVGGGGWMPQTPQRPSDLRVPRARTLRRNATEAEKKLWQNLRQPPFKQHHFRRQATIGPYFADFASHQLRIVIEVDGGQHSDNAADDVRTQYLEASGYRVLRFWNNDVLQNMSGVLMTIDAVINADRPPIPAPPPPQAGGGE